MLGTVLGNRYEIVEKVGVGGMAIVYKAMDKLLNRYVAVKILRSEFWGNEEFIRRFNIESQAAASLSHPNIVSIYDVGQSDDMQYIVMEYIEGKTLKEYIAEKKGNIYWKEATDIAMQICSALEHAHSKHIIHRDIKPQNIMISTDNTIKVTDFGIARAAGIGTMNMDAMGSAHYLSPEQARGGYTDQRSDIYSFGVLMYELFTGKLPFDGETTVAVAMQHMQVEPVKPTDINAEIPKSIENIILKSMSKEQRLRYESAAWLLSDLKRAYYDPDAPIAAAEDDISGTKKITPIVNITMPAENTEKNVVRRSTDERITKKKEPKKNSRKDVVAIVAAVLTCIVIAAVMGVAVANIINGTSSQNAEYYDMPNVKGLGREEMAESLKELRSLGFEIEEIYVADSNIPKGEVIEQEPKMGRIKPGEKITITISSGKEKINLDDYTNMPVNEAIDMLEQSGILAKTSEEMSDDVEQGRVIRQFPTAGNVVETGDSVRLFVSSGPNTFTLDTYVGTESKDACSELEAQGISVNVKEESSDTVPAGIVISQKPGKGAEMKKGDSVELYVSSGPELMTVPKLLGLTQDAAKDALTNNSLKIGSVTEITSAQSKGIVVKQSVAEGTKVKKGTQVDISVSKGSEQALPETNQNGSNNTNESGAGVHTSDTGL